MSQIKIVLSYIKSTLYTYEPQMQMPHIYFTAASAVVQMVRDILFFNVTNQHSPIFYQNSPIYLHASHSFNSSLCSSPNNL